MISFIVPAHNEEVWISDCLAAVRVAMQPAGEDFEIVVVDDASTDNTASLAEKHGARVVRVAHRQISKTRNAGAGEARGDALFFVDADTLVNARMVQSGMRVLREGAVGGGCLPRFEGRLPFWCSLACPLFVGIARFLNQPGGSCLFCRRSVFDAIGGFSEAHYAAEDAVFVTALKRQGRFVVLDEPVVTSGRNLRAHSFWTITLLLARLVFRGPDGFRDRRGLDFWYRPLRDKGR